MFSQRNLCTDCPFEEYIPAISYGHGSVYSDFWYGDGPYPNYYYSEHSYPYPYANYPYYPMHVINH